MEKLTSKEFDFFRKEIFVIADLMSNNHLGQATFKLGNLYEICRQNVLECQKNEELNKEE
jgi:hypothetical protein